MQRHNVLCRHFFNWYKYTFDIKDLAAYLKVAEATISRLKQKQLTGFKWVEMIDLLSDDKAVSYIDHTRYYF